MTAVRQIFLSAFSIFVGATFLNAAEIDKPDFNRDVRPILSQFCFKCHGMDDKSRKGHLRLDIRPEAMKPAKSDAIAIVPGKPEKSELVARIFSDVDEDIMPPPATKMNLTGAQKKILKDWIASGADYAPHWAFEKPVQPAVPVLEKTALINNPIDAFVGARLKREGLTPATPADRRALGRRVYLDLVGLPPTPEEITAFDNDKAPDAFEKLVDKLLASARYGERWARRWLDLARYADTNGYEKDRMRTIWPYRDWVINALNNDMPFDQFSIKQIAGDLLPEAQPNDLIATGFHRNTMLNEEGGIDPLEFRYHAVADRIATTGVAWLGLTVGCAQCHTHKFDPLTHTDYFRLMAFLDNADEPDYAIPDAQREQKKQEIEKKIAVLQSELPTKWRASTGANWIASENVSARAESGAKVEIKADQSIKFGGVLPEKDSYSITFETGAGSVDRLRLEVLKTGSIGPGRTPHGNFVLNEIVLEAARKDAPENFERVKFVRADADYSQKNFDVGGAIDGDQKTGWAVDGDKAGVKSRTAIFYFEKPAAFATNARWRVKLDQNYGEKHVLENFRISVGAPATAGDMDPKKQLERRLTEWEKSESEKAVAWQILRPSAIKTNMTHLTQLEDGSLLGSGDVTKSDTYELKFSEKIQAVTGLRLEVLPHESLPGGGPGLAYYEGPKGDFFISELHLLKGTERLKIARAAQTHPVGDAKGAMLTQDGTMSSGWTTSGALGQAHCAIFEFEKSIDLDGALALKLQFERHYACPLGRFRVSVTTAAKKVEAHKHSADVENALAKPAPDRTPLEKEIILQQFLSTAPELAGAREEITKLKNSILKLQSTLAMRERPANNSRPTLMRNRGEYTQPLDRVQAGVPGFLPPLPPGAKPDRLSFARWLVSPENPLTARVTVNRQWQAFFGRGLVRTLEDFGYQGEMPSHPELLDWLAVEFVKQKWSLKKLHKLIVMSATYQQSSRVSPEMAQRDPANILLSRGPRFRLEAEVVRDSALKAAGLLSEKMGGPGVYPPQPANVTSEGAYGAMTWTASQGEDRFRRSVYTFMKRTAPFAMYNTFDGPTGEACLARREISNSALQALTLLNDTIFVEIAQSVGGMLAKIPGTDEERIKQLYEHFLSRVPSKDEVTALNFFNKNQRERLTSNALNTAQLDGKNGSGDVARAVWYLTARAVMNLDEALTKR